MLEGKRNRRLDHLIYVLVCKTIPYFIAKHRRQHFGFEGPDLELKRRQEIEIRARAITADTIEEEVEGCMFTVRSQTDPKCHYIVDLEVYTCDCDGFPLISFCKHLCAVQTLYPEYVDIRPSFSIFSQCIYGDINTNDAMLIAPPPCTTPPPETTILANLANKLQRLAVRAHLQPLASLTPSLRTLDNALDQVLQELTSPPSVLPVAKAKIAPNQNSWPETANVMGVAVKSKRKRIHTDAYSGGERSGKKAKADARAPLKGQGGIRYVSLTFTAPIRVVLIQSNYNLSRANTLASSATVRPTSCSQPHELQFRPLPIPSTTNRIPPVHTHLATTSLQHLTTQTFTIHHPITQQCPPRHDNGPMLASSSSAYISPPTLDSYPSFPPPIHSYPHHIKHSISPYNVPPTYNAPTSTTALDHPPVYPQFSEQNTSYCGEQVYYQ